MLGQPISMLIPEGRRLPASPAAPPRRPPTAPNPGPHDSPRSFRKHGRGRQVREFHGDGVGQGPQSPTGPTIGNMSPEFGLHLRDLPDRPGDDRVPAADRAPGETPARPGWRRYAKAFRGLWHGPGPPSCRFSEEAHPRPVHGRPLDRRPEAPAGQDRAGQRQEPPSEDALPAYNGRPPTARSPASEPGGDRRHPRDPTRSRSPLRTGGGDDDRPPATSSSGRDHSCTNTSKPVRDDRAPRCSPRRPWKRA